MPGVPIYVICRDRLTSLRALVDWCERAESVSRVVLLDNESTYEPLLEYLNQSQHEVRRTANLGPSGAFRQASADGFPYVITDPDIVPRGDCPLDAITKFIDVLNQCQWARCIGFGLDISDIPDDYPYKGDVIRCESWYWATMAEGTPIPAFHASIDSTFAVYARPDGTSLRSGYPYIARHADWYLTRPFPPDIEHYLVRSSAHGANWTTPAARGLGRMNWHGDGGPYGDGIMVRAEQIARIASRGIYGARPNHEEG